MQIFLYSKLLSWKKKTQQNTGFWGVQSALMEWRENLFNFFGWEGAILGKFWQKYSPSWEILDSPLTPAEDIKKI